MAQRHARRPRLFLVPDENAAAQTDDPALLRLITSCVTTEEFIARYGRFAADNSLSLMMKRPRRDGERRRVELVLNDGRTPVLCGVVVVHTAARAGAATRLEFVELDEASRALFQELHASEFADPPTGEWLPAHHQRMRTLPMPEELVPPSSPADTDDELEEPLVALAEHSLRHTANTHFPRALTSGGSPKTRLPELPTTDPFDDDDEPFMVYDEPAERSRRVAVHTRTVLVRPLDQRLSLGSALVAALCSAAVTLALAYGLWGPNDGSAQRSSLMSTPSVEVVSSMCVDRVTPIRSSRFWRLNRACEVAAARTFRFD